MENKTFIGIDISSKTLDICIRKGKEETFFNINNTPEAISDFFNGLTFKGYVVGMENTGRYNWPLYEVLEDLFVDVYVIPPLHLKKSLGLVRGKDDKIDASRIARFTEKNLSELVVWKAPSKSIQQLKVLLAERNWRIQTKKQLLATAKSYRLMGTIEMENILVELNQQMIESMKAQIDAIEKLIEGIIDADQELSVAAKLLLSVPGIGKVLCWVLLAKTNNFNTITEPRKLACYSGVVPFDYRSGTSIRWKPRVSVYADKTLKSLLHMGAMSAIRLNNDLRVYYQRKVAEGKNKMSVLNAVRNKIIHRACAVIKNQTPYQNNLVLS